MPMALVAKLGSHPVIEPNMLHLPMEFVRRNCLEGLGTALASARSVRTGAYGVHRPSSFHLVASGSHRSRNDPGFAVSGRDSAFAMDQSSSSELRLNTGNPTVENIRKDFERFGFLLDLAGADPANSVRITHLGHLNYWRNSVAHQKATPPPAGVPAVLTLADLQVWRGSCDGLATSLDVIMGNELLRMLGAAPW